MIFQKLKRTATVSMAVVGLAVSGLAVTAPGVMAHGDEAMPEDGAVSGTYKAEATHRYITFSYSHKGYSNPWLRWRDWDATLEWNAEDPAASSVSVVIDVNSIDSGVDVFDDHLKGENMFDVANHPQITFVSTALTKTDDSTGTMTGDLTILGETKPVTLDVTFNQGGYDQRGNKYTLGFSGKTSVNRSDFGIDYAVPFVGDKVDILIEAEFVMPGKK